MLILKFAKLFPNRQIFQKNLKKKIYKTKDEAHLKKK